MEELAYKMRKE